MTIVQTFKHAGKTVEIWADEDPIHPRKDYSVATRMVTWHRRYRWQDGGDSHRDSFIDEADLRDGTTDEILAMKPLYLYEHSGRKLATTPFSCRFDSGHVGWILVTRALALELGVQDFTPAQLDEVIEGEVADFNAYLNGECYGFTVKGAQGDVLDSCGGYLGCLEDCIRDAKASAEGSEDPADDREADFLASRATYAGPCP